MPVLQYFNCKGKSANMFLEKGKRGHRKGDKILINTCELLIISFTI
jgi:hypothetical protein